MKKVRPGTEAFPRAAGKGHRDQRLLWEPVWKLQSQGGANRTAIRL